jgi:hypothetical protein
LYQEYVNNGDLNTYIKGNVHDSFKIKESISKGLLVADNRLKQYLN